MTLEDIMGEWVNDDLYLTAFHVQSLVLRTWGNLPTFTDHHINAALKTLE